MSVVAAVQAQGAAMAQQLSSQSAKVCIALQTAETRRRVKYYALLASGCGCCTAVAVASALCCSDYWTLVKEHAGRDPCQVR
jgi:hypothetical protein